MERQHQTCSVQPSGDGSYIMLESMRDEQGVHPIVFVGGHQLEGCHTAQAGIALGHKLACDADHALSGTQCVHVQVEEVRQAQEEMQEMAAGLQRKNAILRNELRHLRRQVGGGDEHVQQQRNHERSFGGDDDGGHTSDGSRTHRVERER